MVRYCVFIPVWYCRYTGSLSVSHRGIFSTVYIIIHQHPCEWLWHRCSNTAAPVVTQDAQGHLGQRSSPGPDLWGCWPDAVALCLELSLSSLDAAAVHRPKNCHVRLLLPVPCQRDGTGLTGRTTRNVIGEIETIVHWIVSPNICLNCKQIAQRHCV